MLNTTDDNLLVSLAISTGLVEHNKKRTGGFVALTPKGRKKGLFASMVEIASIFRANGIDTQIGGTCPNWGWLHVSKDGNKLANEGDFNIDYR